MVWLPAPGHSVMMSSLASVLVAKANATPEKVVPWRSVSATVPHVQPWRLELAPTHKINADDQLCLGAALARDFGHVRAVVRGRSVRGCGRRRRRCTIAAAVALRGLLLLRRIARRALLRRIAHLLLLLLRGIAGRTSVNRGQRAVGAAVLLARREAAGRSVCVRGRAAEGVLRVHGVGRGQR